MRDVPAAIKSIEFRKEIGERAARRVPVHARVAPSDEGFGHGALTCARETHDENDFPFASGRDRRHRRSIPSPDRRAGWEALVEPRTVVIVEDDGRGASDRLRGVDARCAGDRDDESRKIHQPRQCDLARAGTMPGGNRGERGFGGQPSCP